jgi:hypothetical protein
MNDEEKPEREPRVEWPEPRDDLSEEPSEPWARPGGKGFPGGRGHKKAPHSEE